MFIKQISIFVENSFGTAADILDILAKANINIYALSIADNSDYGIMRLIVDNPEATVELLKSEDIIVKSTDVLAIPIGHKPGGLSNVLQVLKSGNIAIEYMYAFLGRKTDDAVVVAKTHDAENAIKVLNDNGIKPLASEDII